ncbi:MAG: hypothetical protein H8E85_07490 [Candidatus Marinimicrobia bacterium]|nr:hypothetical protein [Candidatus Neomarinimicrobiota bacterium]
MTIKLNQIAHARSGDKGANSNVGLMFKSKELYEWAKSNITTTVVKDFFKSIAKGDIVRYEMDNLLALNFILGDSLGGGGSESLINDAQGKTHGQALLLMEVNLPDELVQFVNS